MAVGLLLGLAGRAAPSWGQVPASDTAGNTNVSGAREHFERALELYRGGRYAEALPELEEAARLDPRGKDLFFNLALVHEKLGELPQAIAALEQFQELETDATERERARLTIERLRGAARAGQGLVLAPPPCPAPTKGPLPAPPPREHGADPVLIGAASVAVVSALVGSVFGLKALSEDVSHESTSAALPVSELHERARRSARDALVADVAFSLALASSATFVGVWLWAPAAQPRSAVVTLGGYF